MPIESREPITDLLRAWQNGDEDALERLTPLIYHQLHKLARQALARERNGHTLQTTAVLNEAFLQLLKQDHMEWRNRDQFFAVAAKVMRRILVDYARKHNAEKRGGTEIKVPLDDVDAPAEIRAAGFVALDDALKALAKYDKRKALVVELRFFGGLSLEETAEILGVHRATVGREWEFARAWLRRELSRGEEP